MNLRIVNRDQGFAAGDELLRTVAACFERAASAHEGALCARLSGGRLAMLVSGATRETAEAWLAAALLDEHDVRLTSVSWQDGEDGFDVVARAKRAAAIGSPA